MIKFESPMKAKLVDDIEHQGIGGRVIIIEREVSLKEVEEHNTIASYNFFMRRPDLISKEDTYKCYYGHVGNLGYFIANDEIDGEMNEVSWSEAAKYLNEII